jgi:hypothetical protein
MDQEVEHGGKAHLQLHLQPWQERSIAEREGSDDGGEGGQGGMSTRTGAPRP